MTRSWLIKMAVVITLGHFMLSAPVCSAYMFTVTMDTSWLLANQPGSYALDFQLIEGGDSSSLGNNTVTLSNFSVDGGAISPGAIITSQGATGDLSTQPFTLSDTYLPGYLGNPVGNEFMQEFTLGNTLSFTVTDYPNLLSPETSLNPDSFSFYMFANGNPIPTTDFFGSFFYQALDPGNPAPVPFASADGHTPSPDFQFPASTVPEPSVVFLFLTGAMVIFARRRNKARVKVLA